MPIDTVKIWINAFIPKDVPGITHPAPEQFPDQTVVDGPFKGGDCFFTDNRSFSPEIHASSRMHSEVEIDFLNKGINFQWHNCSPTHAVNPDTGESTCTESGNTSRMNYSNLRGNTTVDPEGGIYTDPRANIVQIDINAAANNPCVAGSPDIDFFGSIVIDPDAATIEFDGMVDGFPAFEMYAAIDNGAPIAIFQLMPPIGNAPWNLIGEPKIPVKVSQPIA